MTKKEWVLKAFNCEDVDHVPMGFWFHFVNVNATVADTLRDPDFLRQNLAGHERYIKEFSPDFVKIMTDGYFRHPLADGKQILTSMEDLDCIKPIDENHPWIQNQIELARKVCAMENGLLYIYNIFCPVTSLKILMLGAEATLFKSELLTQCLLKDPARVAKALEVLANSLALLVKNVITKGGADGIYYSVGNPDRARISDELYRRYMSPCDKIVLDAANSVSDNNILHICGFEGNRNNLSDFTDYKAKVYNWAANVEGVSLEEGRKLFKGAAILGGYANNKGDILNAGTKEEIQNFAEKIVRGFGKKGLIVGADCTVPQDIPREHLSWVREKLQTL
jgi:uroporphyrinogen decarboxylase